MTRNLYKIKLINFYANESVVTLRIPPLIMNVGTVLFLSCILQSESYNFKAVFSMKTSQFLLA